MRDINLGAWMEAGWMQPIDGLPGLAELNKDIFPFNLEALKYKGKQYGTPYYGDIYVYMYDKKAAQKAGVDKPPVTLEELKQAALAVKKARRSSTRSSRASRPTSTGSTSSGRWSSPRAATSSTRS